MHFTLESEMQQHFVRSHITVCSYSSVIRGDDSLMSRHYPEEEGISILSILNSAEELNLGPCKCVVSTLPLSFIYRAYFKS